MKRGDLLKQGFDLEEILFPIRHGPSSELFPGFEFVRDQEQVIYLPDRKKVISFCSESYRLMSNRDLMVPIWDALLRTYGEAGFDTRIFNYDDRKFYVSLICKARPLALTAADLLYPSLEIRNSYDGSMKFSLALGFFRHRGNVSLMAFQEPVAGEKKHSNRYSPKLGGRALEMLEHADAFRDRFLNLMNRSLSTPEITKLAEELSRKTNYPRRLISDAAHRLYQESEETGKEPNAWTFYCGFNYVLNNADIKMHLEFRERIDREVLRFVERMLKLK